MQAKASLAERLPPRRPRAGPGRLVLQLVVACVAAFAGLWLLRTVGGTAFAPSSGFAALSDWTGMTYTAVGIGAGLVLTLRWGWRRPAVLAAIVSLAVAAVMLRYHANWRTGRVWEGDARLFHRMAEEWPWRPGGWFRYRLLAPWLARLLSPRFVLGVPGATVTDFGYWRLALFSVAATGPALSLLLRDLAFGRAARHLGVLLYLSSFVTLYNTWNYAMPDPLALLFVVLACRSIVRGRDVELAVLLLLGGLTKEVVLFLVPVRWLWARRSGVDVPQALRAGLVALPAVAVFAWLRFRPEEAAQYTQFVTGQAWLYPWKHQPDNLARLYSPFAAGWVLIALSLRRPDRWTIAAIGFAVPCVLSLLVTDAGRMLVYLTPFAIPAMLRAAGAGASVSRRGLAALLLVCLSMRLWEPFAPLWRIPVMVRRPLALLLAVVCVALVRSIRDDSRT